MAVEAFLSAQEVEDYRKLPVEDHGKLRFQYWNLPALTVAGDIGSTLTMCELPPGRIRLLPNLSRWSWSAFGAARTFSIGHRAYRKSGGATVPVMEAEVANAFNSAVDVSAAGNAVELSTTVLKFDIYSLNGVTLYGTVAGGTMPVGLTMSGLFAYLYE